MSPGDSDPGEAERLREEAAELASITRRQLYILVFTGFFLLLTLAGPDAQLVRADATISWPLIQTEIQLSTFLTYAPVALVGLHVYLHLFIGRLIELQRGGIRAPETFVFSMSSLPARIVADTLMYAYVPLILAWFSWKVVFREEGRFLILAALVVTFGSALLYYIRALGSPSRLDRLVGLGLLSTFAIVTGVGSAFVIVRGAGDVLQWRQLDLVRADLGATDEHPYVNIAGVDLSHADMRFARLTGADLRGTRLSGADLSGASIGSPPGDGPARITGLEDAVLTRADLREADLRHVDLDCASLPGADLSQVRFGDTDLRGADLTGSRLLRAILLDGELIFQGARLAGTDFGNAELGQANFRFADLTEANLRGGRYVGASFNSANLAGAILSDADFGRALFRSADLSGADLRNSTFDGADFRGAHLAGADLRGSRGLDGEALARARLCETTAPDGTVLSGDCESGWEASQTDRPCAPAIVRMDPGEAIATPAPAE